MEGSRPFFLQGHEPVPLGLRHRHLSFVHPPSCYYFAATPPIRYFALLGVFPHARIPTASLPLIEEDGQSGRRMAMNIRCFCWNVRCSRWGYFALMLDSRGGGWAGARGSFARREDRRHHSHRRPLGYSITVDGKPALLRSRLGLELADDVKLGEKSVVAEREAKLGRQSLGKRVRQEPQRAGSFQ